RAMTQHDWKTSLAALKDSYRFESNPETLYYIAHVQMLTSDSNQAADSLHLLLGLKGKVLMDSIASLIPLAELDLAACYNRMGKEEEAESIRQNVNKLWEHADPELRAALQAPRHLDSSR